MGFFSLFFPVLVCVLQACESAGMSKKEHQQTRNVNKGVNIAGPRDSPSGVLFSQISALFTKKFNLKHKTALEVDVHFHMTENRNVF